MEKDKALQMALSQIEKQFGHGAIMKLGDSEKDFSIAVQAAKEAGITRLNHLQRSLLF